MSLRSHILAAALPIAALAGGAYTWSEFFEGKLVESSQLDVFLPKEQLRTCGVAKLRSIDGQPRVKDDGVGGLALEYSGEPKMSLWVRSVSDHRTRIQATWRRQDDKPEVRSSYERLSAAVAEHLAQCMAQQH